MKPLLAVEHISKTYGNSRVLQDVAFDLQPGEVHALVGENGAGKSTLIKIIAGVEQPDAGSVFYFNGEKITGLTRCGCYLSGDQFISQFDSGRKYRHGL